MNQNGPRLYLAHKPVPNDWGGGNRANLVCIEELRRTFPIVEQRSEADLQVCSFSWEAPPSPPRVFIDHGSFADASFWAYRAPHLSARDTILVASSVCQGIAARFIEGDGPAVVTVPLPIDTELFAPGADRRAARLSLRDEHGIEADGPLLLVVSSFVRRKNHHLALGLFERLLQRVRTARLAIVGGTPDRPANQAYRAAVADLAVGLGVAPRVQFLGDVPQSRLARLMSGADMLLHLTTCRIENFGLVVAEAMAAGLPVAAADWGGLRDLVVPGRTGLLARTYLSQRGPRVDWLSLVDGAAELLFDARAWERISRSARARALSSFGDETYRERLRAAVQGAYLRSNSPTHPLAFTAPARELVFRTISLNAMHPEIQDVGDEFRLLMPLDGGSHYRLLAGPAASSECPPRVGRQDRLYPVVAWSIQADSVVVTDPVWPDRFAVPPGSLTLVRMCDGKRTLQEIVDEIGPESSGGADIRLAQDLVDLGVLCPRASST